jgi:hypothetical protein
MSARKGEGEMTMQSTVSSTPSTEVESRDRSRIDADMQHGIIGSWLQLAIGMSESTLTFGFGMAQDTRGEIRRRTDATLGFAEEMGVGGFRYARKVVDRVDRLAGELLGRGEAAILVVTRTMRKTGLGVTELASTTVTDTIGSATPRISSARSAS